MGVADSVSCPMWFLRSLKVCCARHIFFKKNNNLWVLLVNLSPVHWVRLWRRFYVNAHPCQAILRGGKNSIFVGFGTGIKVLVFLEYEEVLQWGSCYPLALATYTKCTTFATCYLPATGIAIEKEFKNKTKNQQQPHDKSRYWQTYLAVTLL